MFWGTWFSLSRTMDRLSAETFVAVGHGMIQNLGGPMAILLPLVAVRPEHRPADGVAPSQDGP